MDPSLKLQYLDIDAFRIVQRYFTKTKSAFHTLPLPEERELKVIIKGLPKDIFESEIFEKLSSKGYDVKITCQFANFKIQNFQNSIFQLD